MKAARVVIDCTAKQIDRYFDYRIPENLCGTAKVGMRAEVPFGASDKRSIGYIIKIYDIENEEGKFKEIIKLIDEFPLLSRDALLEAYWIKNRYFCSFSEAIRLFLPTGAIQKITEWVRIIDADKVKTPKQKRVAQFILEQEGVCEYEKIKEYIGASARQIIREMEEMGIVSLSHINKAKVKDNFITLVTLAGEEVPELPPNLKAQVRAVKILSECGVLSMRDLCIFASVTKATVDALHKKGIVSYSKVESLRKVTKNVEVTNETIVLTKEQKDVISCIKEQFDKPFKPVLIKGVTGSGKTEVYMNLAQDIIEKNGSAIILVPEIALTHQMVSRFLSRFGDTVAVLHSGLSIGQRYDEWKRIKAGKAQLVVGARSAVFAPCKNLKMIVVDEEHEDSYKSESGVRYNARDIALCRAKTEGAVSVLASATPSVESYYKAKTDVYTLLKMDSRYNGAPLPETYIVDMREELKNGNRSPISGLLKKEIEKNIENGEQSILFLNKRGHSSFVSCRGCGYVAKCPNCSITLTYHSMSEKLVCHYCGHRINNLKLCPECGSKHIKGFGTGTQKIEENLEQEFPGGKIIRMDTDTTSGRDSHDKILGRFKDENIDILLGTQMISKGLDFKNVTLVGVLAADQSLNMGDYKAAERTFNLITQVCGRAGRGDKEGRAVIQTYMPENSIIEYASRHDYESFYEEEIIIRKALNYPPFCDIINVVLSGNSEREVERAAATLQDKIKSRIGNKIKLYKATPCAILKVNKVFRWHFWMKCSLDKEIGQAVNEIIRSERKVNVIADLNPTSI